MPDYRIDDLAREAGTTVRNVRAYQDRGLLPPPRRQGRVGLYSDTHLARLRLIGQLLERGYTLGNIAELIAAWTEGQNVGELLGFEAALAAPWSDETATSMSADELIALFGASITQETVKEALRLGVLEVDGDRFRINRPRLLEAGVELVRAGVPLEASLAMGHRLQREIDRVARGFVELITTHVFDSLGDPLPPEEVPRLSEVVRRLRPLAAKVVDAELARAMERHVRAQLGDRVERMLGQVRSTEAAS